MSDDGYYCNECRQEGKGNCECPSRCFDCDEDLLDEIVNSDRFVYDEVCYDCLSKRLTKAREAKPKPKPEPGPMTKAVMRDLAAGFKDAFGQGAEQVRLTFGRDVMEAFLAEQGKS